MTTAFSGDKKLIFVSFQKDGIITDPNEITNLDTILSKLNNEIQTLYKPIIQTLLNKPYDNKMLILYTQIKKRLLEEYINFFNH